MTTPVAAFRFVADATDAIADVRKLKSSVDTLDNSKLGGIGGAFDSLSSKLTGVLSVAALVSFGKSALDMADAIGDAAAVAGIAVDSMSRLKYLAEQNDVAFTSLTAGVKQYQDILSNAARGNAESVAALNALGLTAQQLRALKLEDQLALISERFRQLKDPTDQTRISADLFGKAAGPDMVPLLNIGGAAMLQYMQRAEELGLVLDEKTAAAADRATKKIDELGSRLSAFSRDVLVGWIFLAEKAGEATAKMIHGADTVEERLVDQRNKLLLERSVLLERIATDTEQLERSGATAGRVLKTYIDASKRDLMSVTEQLSALNDQLVQLGNSRTAAGAQSGSSAAGATFDPLSEVSVTADSAALSGAEKVRAINIELADDLVAIHNRLGQEKLDQQNVFEQMQLDTQSQFAQQSTELFNATLDLQDQRYSASLAQRLAEDERAEQTKQSFQDATLSTGIAALSAFGAHSKTAAKAAIALNRFQAIANIGMSIAEANAKSISLGPWGWGLIAAGA